jgi:hypothetical protein
LLLLVVLLAAVACCCLFGLTCTRVLPLRETCTVTLSVSVTRLALDQGRCSNWPSSAAAWLSVKFLVMSCVADAGGVAARKHQQTAPNICMITQLDAPWDDPYACLPRCPRCKGPSASSCCVGTWGDLGKPAAGLLPATALLPDSDTQAAASRNQSST